MLTGNETSSERSESRGLTSAAAATDSPDPASREEAKDAVSPVEKEPPPPVETSVVKVEVAHQPHNAKVDDAVPITNAITEASSGLAEAISENKPSEESNANVQEDT